MASTPIVLSADDRLARISVKVERAKKHITELDAACSSFLGARPYALGAKIDPQTRKMVYYLAKAESVPDMFSAITGDIIQNLRSALDHLVAQLWLVNNPRMAEPPSHCHFPTDESLQQYKVTSSAKVKGLRQDAIRMIDSTEPYIGGKGEGLSILNKLNRIDKHRLLITCGGYSGGVNFTYDFFSRWFDMQRPNPRVRTTMDPKSAEVFRGIGMMVYDPANIVQDGNVVRAHSDGKPIFRKFPLKEGDELFSDIPDAKFKPKLEFPIGIALHEPGIAEGKPLLETVQHFTDLVATTITSFRKCLS